ncbi:unnamed protein product [Schistocephalus solidus]|uniref:Uncharacterized protein n=1 Tax=Schistocephalus solidus TaxID=70667 RepID=A0A183T2L9_SCHSO|nr:unnamed protein product [Schistocephalus solidus]
MAKTAVMHQPPPSEKSNVPRISVNCAQLKNVETFAFLENVQGRRLDDTPLRSGDLELLLEPNQETESLPSQLPPQNTEAEMARQDPGHGRPGADQNPQVPHHAEASATAIEWPYDITTTTTPTTDKHFIDAPPLTITDIFLPSPPLAPITGTNTTCLTPANSVAVSDFLPPTTSNTTITSSTSDGDSDRLSPNESSEVVYQTFCNDGDSKYVGEMDENCRLVYMSTNWRLGGKTQTHSLQQPPHSPLQADPLSLRNQQLSALVGNLQAECDQVLASNNELTLELVLLQQRRIALEILLERLTPLEA